ncbi:MAG: response regulator [Methylococcales bacterium]|nr:response regulator [Methylococcales bacterium]MBT7445028.1 response regulator [Methylococcales bacterium]
MSGTTKDYFSSREAAKILGVAVSTVQLWTNSGLLTAWTTKGGHRRIARQSVNDILSQQRVASVADNTVNDEVPSIVIVEDDEQQRKLYHHHLLAHQLEANLVMAKDGYEGLVQIGKVLPSVVITDLVMPKMDGFELIKALVTIPELDHCLIIAVTALSLDEVRQKGSLPDRVMVLTKPFSYEQLVFILKEKSAKNIA